MKQILLRLSFSLPALAMAGCAQKELPVPAHDAGNVITATVDMEQDYRWQLFYDLETNTIAGKTLKTSWDLGFGTNGDDYRIVLNTGKMMFAYNTGKTSLSEVTIADTTGRQRWDNPNGNPDSTAIGDWHNKTTVYIIDRGIGASGQKAGYKKVLFRSADKDRYIVQFAEMDGSGETTVEIGRDSAYNLSFLSFETGGTVIAEPPKTTWDIVFTQYMHIFTDPLMPYLVTGCLLNRYQTQAVKDSARNFQDITAVNLQEYTFSGDINTIGYEWKAYTGSTYVTYPEISYIIRNREGIYYKLHFIDFLHAGVKGNPKWEYQEL